MFFFLVLLNNSILYSSCTDPGIFLSRSRNWFEFIAHFNSQFLSVQLFLHCLFHPELFLCSKLVCFFTLTINIVCLYSIFLFYFKGHCKVKRRICIRSTKPHTISYIVFQHLYIAASFFYFYAGCHQTQYDLIILSIYFIIKPQSQNHIIFYLKRNSKVALSSGILKRRDLILRNFPLDVLDFTWIFRYDAFLYCLI